MSGVVDSEEACLRLQDDYRSTIGKVGGALRGDAFCKVNYVGHKEC